MALPISYKVHVNTRTTVRDEDGSSGGKKGEMGDQGGIMILYVYGPVYRASN